MHQKRYYTMVGMFVVGALILIIFGAGFFYNQYLQAQMETYVMFFKGSLKGLEVTSSVSYRGVKIGEVRLIEITENAAKNKVDIPVYVNFFVEKSFGISHRPIRVLINNGFVASISQPNLLTGIAQIELVQSDTIKTPIISSYHDYPIFPTSTAIKKPTTFDETLKTAKKTLEDISRFLQAKEIKQTLLAAQDMAGSFEHLADKLNQNTSPFVTYFIDSLSQIAKAANSIQNLTDYLSRHPESLLRGKS